MKISLSKITGRLQNFALTDVKYLLKGGSWVTLDYLIQVIGGLVVTVVLANTLDKQLLGTYQFIIAVAGILGVFTLSGIGPAITAAVARGDDGVLRSGMHLKAKWSIWIIIFSGLISGYYYLQNDPVLGTAFFIVGLSVPIIQTLELYQPFLFGKEAFKDSVLLGIWRKIIPIVAVVVTVFLTQNLVILIAAYFFSNALAMTLVYASTIRKYRPGLSHDAQMINHGKHLSVFKVLGTIGIHIDKILIWHFLGPAEVAIYTIAQLAMVYSGGIVSSLQSIVLPKFAKRDLPTLQKTLPRKVLLFTAILGVAGLLYMILIPVVFSILFPRYSEAVPLAQLFGLSFLLLPRVIFGRVLIAHQLIKEQYVLNLFSALTRVFLILTLLPAYGLWGAVYAVIIADMLNFGLSYYLFRKAPITFISPLHKHE